MLHTPLELFLHLSRNAAVGRRRIGGIEAFLERDLLAQHRMGRLDAETMLEDGRCLIDGQSLGLGVAEENKNVANYDEGQVEAISPRSSERFQLGEVGHRHDQVGDPARGGGDGGTGGSDLKGEELGLIPDDVRVGHTEGAGE